MSELKNFLEAVSGERFLWFLKRLSGNDTLANKSHQAGPYLPKSLLFEVFPEMVNQTGSNQKSKLTVEIVSHNDRAEAIATWYNNKFRGGTRNESRLTGFGGKSSALLDPENTGALVLFAFKLPGENTSRSCQAWVCTTVAEEEVIESLIGPVDPGAGNIYFPHYATIQKYFAPSTSSCWLKPDEIRAEWFEKFPPGQTFVDIAVNRIQARRSGPGPDERLVKRRKCEFEAFRSVEEAVELELILRGFSDIDCFLAKAQSILQRRKSRSGRSLELHVKKVFEEEGLTPDNDFSWQPTTEMGKKPDFVFPSVDKYNDKQYSSEKLMMLAVKTTCKDRWRQVINEADRIKTKHLLTLQEGISVNQHREMQSEGIQLVVPKKIRGKFNKEFRSDLMTLESFIDTVKKLG